jgi:LysR family nitrogen assimilation transcriptional regulator
MRKATPITALANLPLILTARPNSLRLLVENGLGQLGLRTTVRVEADTLPLMTDLVIAGLGYSVLPMCGVRDLVKAGLVSASPIADLFITWLAVRPRTHALSAAAERFHDMLYGFSRQLIRQGIWHEA